MSLCGVPDQFPAGLRVIVVDGDSTCLMILGKMLRHCNYEVTTCNRAEVALSLLRENINGFDVVISEVHMPDMDGFKLLEQIHLEMDLPVIMMSADSSKSAVMKGVTYGACDYLIKPVCIEALRNIWQHVLRKRKDEWRDFDPSTNADKPRVVWSIELHQQFVAAVNQLGIDKAVPKKILELMNVPGLTRQNVASHLQVSISSIYPISGTRGKVLSVGVRVQVTRGNNNIYNFLLSFEYISLSAMHPRLWGPHSY